MRLKLFKIEYETYVTLRKRQQMTIIYDMKQMGERCISSADENYHRKGNDYETFQKTNIFAVVYFSFDSRQRRGDGCQ